MSNLNIDLKLKRKYFDRADKVFRFSLPVGISILIIVFLFQNTIYTYGSGGISNSSQVSDKKLKASLVDHFVIIVQGGHSFDNYFGTFPNADGFPKDIKIPLNPFSGQNTSYVKPFHIQFGKYFKPNDDNYRLSYNNGSMNGFIYASRNVPNNPQNVMGFYDNKNIPYYWQFASEYVLAQRFFSPSMRSDLVNGLYAIGADPSPYLNLKRIPENGLKVNRTIFDELESKGISWKVYIENYSDVKYMDRQDRSNVIKNIPILGINRFNDNQSLSSRFGDFFNYYRDIRTNNLPKVSYLYFTNTNDSPNTKIKDGQRLVATLVYALMKSNYWKSTAIIVTQNEPGGWYDHVKPPINNNTKELYGFRLPTIFISPYAKRGYIDSHVYDISSVLRFITSSLGLNSTLKSAKNAGSIFQAFDFTMPPRKPIYFEEISRETNLAKSKHIEGINNLYAISLLIPTIISIIWYRKERSTG